LSIKQGYHGGAIYHDAVEHSWAWTGNVRYETWDRLLQDKLLELSRNADLFIDIGANVGDISMSVALRNRKIPVIAIEPNRRAVELMRKSVKHNRLSDRFRIIEAVFGDKDGTLYFDEGGSVVGHVSNTGRKVTCIDFSRFTQKALGSWRCLVKMDIEGYETVLLPKLKNIRGKDHLTVVVEIHPQSFNGYGAPKENLARLVSSGARLTDLAGKSVRALPQNEVSQVIATWK